MTDFTARISLRDVAAAAGVSVSTASRVLNGTRPVDPYLTEHVRSIAENLGYTANPAAQALRSGTTGSIGVLVPSLTNAFFPMLVTAIQREALAHNLSIVLTISDEDPTEEARQLRGFTRSVADGCVVVPSLSQGNRSELEAAAKRLPVVQVDRRLAIDGVGFVGTDARAALTTLVDHLHSRGWDRLVWIGISDETIAGAERLAAFNELSTIDDQVILLPDYSRDSGRLGAERLTVVEGRRTAVICSSDVLTVGLVTTLQSAGYAIPRDIGIASFDGTELTELVHPGITSLRQPVEEIAQAAVTYVLTKPVSITHQLFESELVIRAST